MTLLRLAVAMAVTRAAAAVAVALVPELEADNQPAHHPEKGANLHSSAAHCLHPVEQILLGSIVGLGIAGAWILICARVSP